MDAESVIRSATRKFHQNEINKAAFDAERERAMRMGLSDIQVRLVIVREQRIMERDGY